MKLAEKLTESQFNEMAMAFAKAAALVKTTVGVGNNAAWMACLDAFDHIRQHPAYRHRVKAAYKKCFEALHAYERQLVYARTNRFFHLDDMTPDTRKVYGNITDRDYYDFWAAFGYSAYECTKPFYTCLVNKLRLAYLAHGYPHPDILAWSTAAGLCLDMAAQLYSSTIDRCTDAEEWHHLAIPRKGWEFLFSSFNISHVAHLWTEAHRLLSGQNEFCLEPDEKRNIEIGYQQLLEKWLDEDTLFGSRIKTCDDYSEVFRTRGEMRKVQQEFAQIRNDIKKYKQ